MRHDDSNLMSSAPSKLEIRHAETLREIDLMSDVAKAAGLETSGDDLLTNMLMNRAESFCRMLTVDGEIVAFAVSMRYFGGLVATLELIVHPDHRRKGYGFMLAEEMRALCTAAGCVRMLSAVRSQNAIGGDFLRRCGFNAKRFVRSGPSWEVITFASELSTPAASAAIPAKCETGWNLFTASFWSTKPF